MNFAGSRAAANELVGVETQSADWRCNKLVLAEANWTIADRQTEDDNLR